MKNYCLSYVATFLRRTIIEVRICYCWPRTAFTHTTRSTTAFAIIWNIFFTCRELGQLANDISRCIFGQCAVLGHQSNASLFKSQISWPMFFNDGLGRVVSNLGALVFRLFSLSKVAPETTRLLRPPPPTGQCLCGNLQRSYPQHRRSAVRTSTGKYFSLWIHLLVAFNIRKWNTDTSDQLMHI